MEGVELGRKEADHSPARLAMHVRAATSGSWAFQWQERDPNPRPWQQLYLRQAVGRPCWPACDSLLLDSPKGGGWPVGAVPL